MNNTMRNIYSLGKPYLSKNYTYLQQISELTTLQSIKMDEQTTQTVVAYRKKK